MNTSVVKQKIPCLYLVVSEAKTYYKDYKYNKYWKRYPIDKYQQVIDTRYKKSFDQGVNWNNPTCFTEKMQWDKLYNRDKRKTLLSDKYLVRQWIADTIGPEYLVPLLGVWRQVNDIPWKTLPNSFVIKTNKGSGDVKIIHDKNSLSFLEKGIIKRDLRSALRRNYAYSTCLELQYDGIDPFIIAEEYLGDNIQDYKFLCFNGTPYYCWVDIDRFSNHRRNIYDLQWNKCNWSLGYPNTDKIIPRPKNYEKMIELASILCKDFAHVRVDFYNIDGRIFFGEMTFSTGSGFKIIDPPEMNEYLGSLWPIDNK